MLTGPQLALEISGERQHSAVVYNETGYSELRCGYVDVEAVVTRGRKGGFATWEGATLELRTLGSDHLLGTGEFSAEEITEWMGSARITAGESQWMSWFAWGTEPFRATIEYHYRPKGRGSVRSTTFDFTCTRPVSRISSTFLSFRSSTGDYIGGGRSQHFGLADGEWWSIARLAPGGFGVDHVWVSLDGKESWNLNVGSPEGSLLVPRSYPIAVRWPFHNPPYAGLSFWGNGRGCNTLRGEFTVHELVVGPENAVERFHANFTQHCEGEAPALTGEIGFVAPTGAWVSGSAGSVEGAERGAAGIGGAVVRQHGALQYFPVLR